MEDSNYKSDHSNCISYTTRLVDNDLVDADQALSRNRRVLQGDLDLLEVDDQTPLDHLLAGGNELADILSDNFTTDQKKSLQSLRSKQSTKLHHLIDMNKIKKYKKYNEERSNLANVRSVTP